jgi:2'-5' RNA ligase
VGESARREAEEILERLARTDADVKWVRTAQLHATIRFLGDIAADRAERVAAEVQGAAARHGSFAWGLGRLGTFPEQGTPRVIWAGVETGERRLSELAAGVEEGLVRGGLVSPELRPFRAHVTLGRSRSPRGSERLRSLLEELSFRSPPEPLEELSLVESRLTPRGSEYFVRARAPLAGVRTNRDRVEHGGETSR